MNKKDIRWQQRFSNYIKALKKLQQAIEFVNSELQEKEIEETDNEDTEVLDEIVKEGLIQRFEYTHELAWNVMKDFLEEAGIKEIYGSKDTTREAFRTGLIKDGDVWMEMIKSRNKTSHTYNEETANEIYHKIKEYYYAAFENFRDTMEEKRSGEQQSLFDK